ncbi:MAG TPA: UDP-N-acetylglucosamine 1-carboxyvinyltransferase [Candidatus Omnitrophica bacterium]|nr:UDP-N-acetylglucosamine 1-carboxyvinyltransferase [Candidatus Omnitrophota bacterium]
MDKIEILGGKRLSGTVEVSGAKNALLPILAASLLTPEKCTIRNVSRLKDVSTMLKIMEGLGVNVKQRSDSIEVESGYFQGNEASYDLVKTMRASICILGPLLARKKIARVSLPGGCIIGSRPIDLHFKGLRALGADIECRHGYINAEVDALRGRRIYLGGPFGSSVLATANVMMAAATAEGTTYIESAAAEPELADLAEFLKKMGASIEGAGTPIVKIEGVKNLKGAEHAVIPDRIEAGTYLVAGAITGGDVFVKNARIDHLGAVLDVLDSAGCAMEVKDEGINIKSEGRVKSVEITTLPYPGFPTDMQAQFMSLLSVAKGISIITEKVFPERFIHVGELNRMGAAINLEGPTAIIKGVKSLGGTDVMASDLRASAALVLSGLVAEGKTTVSRVYHLDRGYENMVEKLQALGADINRVK